jgi:anti-sigma factor (TIGR02949 family)
VACENNRLLHAYLDGELDAVRNIEFEQHLQSCPECAQDLRDQQILRESLRASNLYEPAPQNLRARVRAVLPREIQRRPSGLEWLLAAAAIIIAVVFGAKVIPNVGGQKQADLLPQEIVASHIRSLQPGHLFDVQSTDKHTVKPWFDGKLDFAPPVIDLASQGFPLVGGRLDYLDHRDVAALVYQRQKHLINVFVWPGESKPSGLPEMRTIQGYNLVFWWRDGMYFCAASDLNAAELNQFVQLLEQ